MVEQRLCICDDDSGLILEGEKEGTGGGKLEEIKAQGSYY